jgi:hypothetical protein
MDTVERDEGRETTRGSELQNVATHHERLEIRPPPLRKAVSNLPVVIHPVRCIELDRAGGWCQPVV